MAEFALPQLHSRRRKPWRPVTRALLLVAIALHVDGFWLVAFAWAGIDRLCCALVAPIVLLIARLAWAMFQVERRKDES